MDATVIMWIIALALAAGVAFLVYHRLSSTTPTTPATPDALPPPGAIIVKGGSLDKDGKLIVVQR